MKRTILLALSCGIFLDASLAFAGGMDAGAYIEQVGGSVARTLSMEDVMAPVASLARSLPRMEVVQGNYSLVLQNGAYNNAAVVQAGTRNAALIAQTGYQNSAYLQQFGSGHQGFIIQNGTGNFASVKQR